MVAGRRVLVYADSGWPLYGATFFDTLRIPIWRWWAGGDLVVDASQPMALRARSVSILDKVKQTSGSPDSGLAKTGVAMTHTPLTRSMRSAFPCRITWFTGPATWLSPAHKDLET